MEVPRMLYSVDMYHGFLAFSILEWKYFPAHFVEQNKFATQKNNIFNCISIANCIQTKALRNFLSDKQDMLIKDICDKRFYMIESMFSLEGLRTT